MSASTEKKTINENQYVDSQALLQGKSQVIIKHGEVLYKLAVTRENKLILTK